MMYKADKTYENIRNRRIALGLTQAELAEKVGYSDKAMISKVEYGQIDLPISKLLTIADALDTTAIKLLGMEQDNSTFVKLFDQLSQDDQAWIIGKMTMMLESKKDGKVG